MFTRRVALLVAIGLTLLAGAGSGPALASIGTLTVNKDDPSCSDTTGTPDYCTIHAAVIAASSGDEIDVVRSPTTYGLEVLNVDKVLTLKGAQAGVDGRTGRPVVGVETIARLDITAGDITLDGFDFDAAGAQFAVRATYAAAGTHNGLVVKNSVLENGGTFGLEVDSNSKLASVTAQKNYFKDTDNAGDNANQLWAISPDTTTKKVLDNKFTGNDNADINLNWGDVTVTGNESVNDATLLVVTEADPVDVENNTGTFNGDGTALYFGKGNHNLTIKNNSVSGGYRGIKVASDFGGANGGASTVATITGNTITNPVVQGIFVQNGAYSGAITITKNVITGTSVPGVVFDSGSGVTAAGSAVNRNNLAAATVGITWPESGTLDGTCNWWGSASGPAGGAVSGNVNTLPWLTTSDLNGTCNGYPTIGNTTVGGLTHTLGGNYLEVSGPFTLGSARSLVMLTGRLAGGGSATNMRAVVYMDNGSGRPGAFAAVSQQVAIGAGQAAGWVDFPVSGSPLLAAGQYWLGYWSSNTSAIGYYQSVPNGGRYTPAAYSSGSNPLANFGTGPATRSVTRSTRVSVRS